MRAQLRPKPNRSLRKSAQELPILAHDLLSPFHLMREYRNVSRDAIGSVERLGQIQLVAPLDVQPSEHLLGKHYTCRVPDRNEFERLVHTSVIACKLWIDTGAPLGTVGAR